MLESNGKIFAGTTSNGAIDDGLGHQIVVVHSSTTRSIYIDGALDIATALGSGVNGVAGMYVGDWPGASNVTRWKDKIDELVFYNYALSSSQVVAHYNAGKAGSAGAWGNQLTGTRVGKILDSVGWPTPDRNIDAGNSTLQPTTLGVTAKAALDSAIRSEQGAGFFQQDGKYRFRARQTILSASIHTTPQATFGDGGGTEIPYMDIDQFDYSVDKIINEVHGNRRGGPTAIAIDSTSQTNYLHRVDTDTLADLEVSTDGEVVDAVNWRVAHYKDPLSRPLRVMVKPVTASEWAAVLGREIGHRITLKRRVPPSSDVISKDVLIERIEDVNPQVGDYAVIFDVSLADTQEYWILGTSQLGTGTRLGY